MVKRFEKGICIVLDILYWAWAQSPRRLALSVDGIHLLLFSWWSLLAELIASLTIAKKTR
jgi:hypothetical protein